jgi:carboxyl-terminal processing protease
LAKYYRVSGGSTQKVGVIPHVEFPNIYDRSIYTENSRKNALKWDKIREISYDEKEFVSQKLVDHLIIKFNKDLNSDSTFINYMSYVSKIKENRNKLSVTLNYNKRLQEKKNNSLKNNSLDTSVKITEIFPIEEKNLMDKIKNDLYLRESLKLFAEMLGFKES